MNDDTTPRDAIDAIELPDDLPALALAGDPLDTLTIRELRVANGKLRADVAHAITEPTEDRWDAMALVAWMHAKRQDPTAKLDPWLALTAAQLMKALEGPAPVDPVAMDSDTTTDAVPTATIDDVVRQATEDPTAHTDGR